MPSRHFRQDGIMLLSKVGNYFTRLMYLSISIACIEAKYFSLISVYTLRASALLPSF